MDPNFIFMLVVSFIMIFAVIATAIVYLSDYFQKRSHPKQKHA